MIYDFIFGKTIAKDAIRGIYSNRIESDEISSYGQLVNVLTTNLNSAFENVESAPEVVANAISELSILNNQLQGGATIELIDVKIKEILSALAFNDYEVYLIKRADLKSTDMDASAVRGYMINKNDTFFPTLARMANGTSLKFKNPSEASISDVVMTFAQDTKFSSYVESATQMQQRISDYNLLASSNSGWMYNITDIEKFYNDYGYYFFIVV